MAKIPSNNEFFDSLISSIISNIKTDEKLGIIEFADEIIFNGEGLKLYPTQRALLKSFYNEPLLEDERQVLQEWAKDGCTTWVENRTYTSLVLESGRRGSKSTCASIMVLYEFYNLITLESPAKRYGLLPSSPIAILVIGQSADQVKETIFAAIKGYAENSYFFKGLSDNGIIEILGTEIRCPSKNVAIYAKSTNLKALVGFSLKALVLDEVSRFSTSEETGINIAFEVWKNTAKGCSLYSDYIYTTKGSITYEQLLNKYNNKQQIGISTFDLKTGNNYITEDIKVWDNGIEPVIKLKTSSGKESSYTYDHPFLVWNSEDLEPHWKQLCNLQLGDVIATCNDISIESNTNPFLNLGVSRAKLLGYLQGDGGTTISVRFTNTDLEIISDIQEILNKEFPSHIIVNSDCKRDYQWKIVKNEYVRNSKDHPINLVFEWLHSIKCSGIKSIHKRVPDCIKSGTKEEVAAFLNGLYSTDGFITLPGTINNKANLEISINLSSENFIKDIQRELIKFGIYSKITSKKASYTWKGIRKEKSCWLLCINDRNSLLKFIEHIGVSGAKTNKLVLLKKLVLKRKDNCKSIYNQMPEGAVYRMSVLRKEKNITYTTLRSQLPNLRCLENTKRLSKQQTLVIGELLEDEILVNYSQSKICWETVTDLDCSSQPQKTIAIEVSDTNIIGNDIISHNTAAFGKDAKKIAISSAWENGDPIQQLREAAEKDPQSLAFQLTTFQLNLGLKKGITPIIVSDYATDPISSRLEYENIRFSKHNTFIPKDNLDKACIGVTCIDAQPTDIDIEIQGDKRHYVGIEILRLANADINQTSFIHVDPALKKDSAALAITSPLKLQDGKYAIQIDGLLKWEPHVDSNGRKRLVSFIDIEEKLNILSSSRNVRLISFDSWNSASFIQRLHMDGISTIEMSTSRDMQIIYYTLFRDLLSHNLIVFPKDSLWTGQAIIELSELVMKSDKRIIHPTAGKDLADAIVNATFNCFQFMTDTGLCTGLSSGISKVGSSTLAQLGTPLNNKKVTIGSAISKLRTLRKH